MEWREIAHAQQGLITRSQLRACGVTRGMIRHRISTDRWVARSSLVIGTTTGELTRPQLIRLGALHAGRDSLIGDLTAAELGGLRNWYRDEITVLVPQGRELGPPLAGIRFVETRRPLVSMARPDLDPPTCQIEPAVLHFAAYQPSRRTAEGVVAAAVQQGLTTPALLRSWVDRLRPLRWASMFRQTLNEIEDGSQSVAELDVLRMCRDYGLCVPRRQTKRRDSLGRIRFTDCEWLLPDGRTLTLEVDGAFHMDVEHWEDDLARQRSLAAHGGLQIRCTARELRETPGRVAHDLRQLGVPRAA